MNTLQVESKHKLDLDNLKPIVGVCNDTDWYIKSRKHLELQGIAPCINISVVIPYYKRPFTLKQTLFSFLQSSYDLNLVEFVIADDGSDNKNQPNLQEYIDLGLDIKYVWQRDLGFRLSAVRNLGIAAAKYDNIVILDCDLVVSKDFLLEHAWPLYISKNLISIGLRESRTYPSNNVNIFKDKCPSEIGQFESKDWRLDSWLNKVKNFEYSDKCWRVCSGGNIAFHRSCFERIGKFEERFTFWGGEDLEWAYRAYKKGVYFLVNKEAYAYHFESKKEEHQENRVEGKVEKENLLKNLVPSWKKGIERTEGEVPFISVFMPLFNKANYLKDAILSVDKATMCRYEIVIVDDGSKDNYKEVLNDLPPKIKGRIVLHERTHKGAELTYKDCLDMCRGEYIAQLDADDILLPNVIDRLVDVLDDSVFDLAYGKYKKFEETPKITENGWEYPNCDRFRSLFVGMHTHPLRVFKARALHRSLGFGSLGIEAAVDFSLYSQILLLSYGVFVDEYTYLYRQVKTSLSFEKKNKQTENTKTVVDRNLQLMLKYTDCDVWVEPVGEKSFELHSNNHFAMLGYLDHLQLEPSTARFVFDNASLCIGTPFSRLGTDLCKFRTTIKDSITSLEYTVVLDSDQYIKHYNECKKKNIQPRSEPMLSVQKVTSM